MSNKNKLQIQAVHISNTTKSMWIKYGEGGGDDFLS